MNELERLLITRRSCRAYKPDAIPEDVLERIIEAGKYAPTGRNRQAPIIIAVTNREMRDRMSALNAAVMGVDSDPFYGAPVVLVVLAKKDVPTYVYDGSLVMGNLMNAAHSEGVASCWIHRAREVFESAEGREILSSLGIDGEYEGIGNCILGYPVYAEAPTAAPRKEDYVYYIK